MPQGGRQATEINTVSLLTDKKGDFGSKNRSEASKRTRALMAGASLRRVERNVHGALQLAFLLPRVLGRFSSRWRSPTRLQNTAVP